MKFNHCSLQHLTTSDGSVAIVDQLQKLLRRVPVSIACLMLCAPVLAQISPANAANQAIAPERQIVAQIIASASLNDTFLAWSTAQGITSFFAPGAVIDATPGGLFEVHMSPESPAGQRGADDMRVLAVQAPTMISFTWNAPPHLPEARKQRTSVVVRLAELPTDPNGKPQTLVRLTHAGFGDGGEWDKTHAYFVRAWPNVLSNLKKRFDTGPVDWAPWLAQLRAMATKQAPASQPESKTASPK